jgi:serpin B
MKSKKVISGFLCAALICAALCACSDPNVFSDKELLSAGYTRSDDVKKTYNYADGAAEPPGAYNSYANLITGYELKLFRNAAVGNSTFVFSPAANALGLSLLANGAKGDTLSEIKLALGLDLSNEDLNTCSSYFKSRLESVRKKEGSKTDELSGKTVAEENPAELKIGEALLFNNKSDVRTAFLQNNADFYGADIARFDFADNANAAKLNSLLDIDYGEKLISGNDGSLRAVSYIDIKDLWLSPYSSEDIIDGKFGGKQVSFMRSSDSFIYSPSAKGIIKYTAKNPLKLVLVMPNENIKIGDYIKTFDSVEYTKLLESFSVTSRADASVPQFEIKSSDEPESMSGAMQKSGLYTLFSDKTDLGDLAHSDDVKPDGFYELKTGFCLDKNGVSTASDKLAEVTLAKNDTNAVSPGKNTQLVFDRPFIFMLIDNESNIPVYMGVYSGTQ